MTIYGASFSGPYAEYLGVKPKQCLQAAISDLGVRRFRLMSYWNRLEPRQGKYDFSELDWQIELCRREGAKVTLCIGLRQPRWPESHWPEWALKLSEQEWQAALLKFIEQIIERYKDEDCIVSYQLENEAFNRSFGEHGDFNRDRLKQEMKFVKRLDPSRPVIMSTSNSWGLPLLGPRPDIYGFSIYRRMHMNGNYRHSKLWPGFYRFRAFMIRLFQWRPTYIHELQAEPWGPGGIKDMDLAEQYKSMDPAKVKHAVEFAKKTKLYPIDLWGLEWWYWLKTEHNQPEIWNYLRSIYKDS